MHQTRLTFPVVPSKRKEPESANPEKLQSASVVHTPASKTASISSSPPLTTTPKSKSIANPPESSNTNSAENKAAHESKTLTITSHHGSLFSAPANTVLIHACNTQGSWGAGIAAAFRANYPSAYKVYRDYCTRTHDPSSNPIPTGTCFLIPPCETKASAEKHWIACLFTSARYGKRKDGPAEILANTEAAIREMLEKVKQVEEAGDEIGALWMCRINSGKFGVPWRKTVTVLESVEVRDGERNDVEVWAIED